MGTEGTHGEGEARNGESALGDVLDFSEQAEEHTEMRPVQRLDWLTDREAQGSTTIEDKPAGDASELELNVAEAALDDAAACNDEKEPSPSSLLTSSQPAEASPSTVETCSPSAEQANSGTGDVDGEPAKENAEIPIEDIVESVLEGVTTEQGPTAILRSETEALEEELADGAGFLPFNEA